LPADRPFEFMLNALRLTDGFPVALFPERTGLSLQIIQPQLRQAERDGLVIMEDGILRPTALGLNFYNDLCVRFVP
ncbi:oxygen-independent coproporphyrinogen III oxidase-like protein, partial [Acidithiobacillus ferrooxidans]|nr:oxygen-independent coproporphyrinogen III oxidase-like protein [Acidithiobacillus ferrooxidans]